MNVACPLRYRGQTRSRTAGMGCCMLGKEIDLKPAARIVLSRIVVDPAPSHASSLLPPSAAMHRCSEKGGWKLMESASDLHSQQTEADCQISEVCWARRTSPWMATFDISALPCTDDAVGLASEIRFASVRLATTTDMGNIVPIAGLVGLMPTSAFRGKRPYTFETSYVCCRKIDLILKPQLAEMKVTF